MSKYATKAIVRLFLALAYCGVVYYNEKYVFLGSSQESDSEADTESSIFTGKYAFLTNLNLVFLTGCLVYSAVCSCLVPKTNFLHKLNGFLGGTSSTMSLFVFAIFWTLFAIDRELVYPTYLDKIIPPLHNHALHTAIVPASFVNFGLVSRRDAPRLLTQQLAASFLGLAYIAWIHVIHAATGLWVYPVLEVLTGPQRLLFIGACCLALLPFASAVYWLHRALLDRPEAGGKSRKVN